MALIQPEDKRKPVTLAGPIPPDDYAEFQAYCRATESSVGHVLTAAVRKLTQDPEFRKLLKAQPELLREPEANSNGQKRQRQAKAQVA